MPCNPGDVNISPPTPSPISIPGFGIPSMEIGFPLPNVKIPTNLLEDLLDLVNSIGALFPSGTFKPNVDDFTKSIMDAIAKVMAQIAPFLSFYNFVMALFNLIICIIEVLCAIPNPIKIAKAMMKLFKKCLPPFMLLFPWLALIAMIIALLLLILALIEYIINTIIAIILDIIKDILTLKKAIEYKNADAVVAEIRKIASLTCLIQNLLAILVAIGAIISIIESLAKFAGGNVCDDTDPEGCCSSDVCPPFIKDNVDGVKGKLGKLTYLSQVGSDVKGLFSGAFPGGVPDALAALLNIPPLRTETWQLVDTALVQKYKFTDIITPIFSTNPFGISVFWPEGLSFTADTPPGKAPYTVDIKLKTDPNKFAIQDAKGERYFFIKDCIVLNKPYIGIKTYNNLVDETLSTGTLSISGGLVFEEDEKTQFKINGKQATLSNFIHVDPSLTSDPSFPVDDGYYFSDVEFTLRPVLPTLMSYQLITAGCIPEVAIEKAVTNARANADDQRAVQDKMPTLTDGVAVPATGFMPNVNGAQKCVSSAITKFRTNISIETAAELQAAVETCLGDLRNQTIEAYKNAVRVGSSQFGSKASLSTNLEFVTRSIDANVILCDPAGTNIGLNIPAALSDDIAKSITGEVTLGELSAFQYDGSGSFNASISSKLPGTGTLTVKINDRVLSKVTNSDTSSSKIEENILTYTFVDASVEPVVRRNESDTAENKG